MNGQSWRYANEIQKVLRVTEDPFKEEKRRVGAILAALRASQERRLLAEKNGRRP